MTTMPNYWENMVNMHAEKLSDTSDLELAYLSGRNAVRFEDSLSGLEEFERGYDNKMSFLQHAANRRRQSQLKFEEDILAEREDPTGRFKDLTIADDLMDPENMILRDLDGEWINLREGLDDAVGYGFQNENRTTLLGSSTNAIEQDIRNIVGEFDSAVAEEVFPISAEAQQLIEEWGDLNSAPVEAFIDIFRAVGPGERKVLFRYDNPILDLIHSTDPNWDDEAKNRAWTLLNNSDVYGNILETIGYTKEDLMRTRSPLELRYNINNRRNAIVAGNITKHMPVTKDIGTFAIWSKRFILDNFVNDPDTAVEVGAAIALYASGWLTGGSTALAATAMLGKTGKRLVSGLNRYAAFRGLGVGIDFTSGLLKTAPKFLPTQIVSNVVFPTAKGVRQGVGFRKALKTAIRNPEPPSWGEFLLGAGIEGGLAEFGAYFVNLAELKQLNDAVYGEGNHLVDFRWMDLLGSVTMGSVFSTVLGTSIRGLGAAVNAVNLSGVAGKMINDEKIANFNEFLQGVKDTREDILVDVFTKRWTGEYRVPDMQDFPRLRNLVNEAKNSNFDIEASIRKINQDIYNEGKMGQLSVNSVIERLENDFNEWKVSAAREAEKVLGGVGDEVAQTLASDNRDVTEQELNAAQKEAENPNTDSSTGDGRVKVVQQAVASVTDGASLRNEHDDLSKKVQEVSETVSTERNPQKLAKAKEELAELRKQRDEVNKQLKEIDGSWRITRMRAHKSTVILKELEDIRRVAREYDRGTLNKSNLNRILGSLTQTNTVVKNQLKNMKGNDALMPEDFVALMQRIEEEELAKAFYITKDDIRADQIRSFYGEEMLEKIRRKQQAELEAQKELGIDYDPEFFRVKVVRPDVRAAEESIIKYDKAIGRTYDTENPAPKSHKDFMERATTDSQGRKIFKLDDDVTLVYDKGEYFLETVGYERDSVMFTKPDAPLTTGVEAQRRWNEYSQVYGKEYPELFDTLNLRSKDKAAEKIAKVKHLEEKLVKKSVAADRQKKTTVTNEKRFDQPYKAIRHYERTSYVDLMNDNWQARQFYRGVESEVQTNLAVQKDIAAIDRTLQGLKALEDSGLPTVRIDVLHRIFPSSHRAMLEKFVEDADVIESDGRINVKLLHRKLMERLAEVDPSVARHVNAKITAELNRLKATDQIGNRKSTPINKLELAQELHAANTRVVRDAVAADGSLRAITPDGVDKASGERARLAIIKSIHDTLDDPDPEIRQARRDMYEDLDPTGKIQAEESVDDRGEMLLRAFEDKYLPENIKSIEDFGNGNVGISSANQIGRGIVDIYLGREGSSRSREILEEGFTQDGKLRTSYQLGAILRRNNASPETSRRVAELYEDFVSHARSNHLFTFDENGEFVELSAEDIDTLEAWLRNPKKELGMHLPRHLRGIRLIPQRALYHPRQDLPDLDKIMEDAFEDLVLLPPTMIGTVHDSITISNPELWGSVAGAREHVSHDAERMRGITLGFPTLVAIPGGFKDAMNRTIEMMFPETSGLVARARVEAEELLKRPPTEAELADMLLEGKVGKMKIPTLDEVKAEFREKYGVKELNNEQLKEARSSQKKREAEIKKIQKAGPDYIDANGSGPNIIQLHSNIAYAIANDKDMMNLYTDYATANAPDLYLKVQEYIVKEFKENPELARETQEGGWWHENIFSKTVDPEAKNFGLAGEIRNLMKGPVMTIPYNAGMNSLKSNITEWLNNLPSNIKEELGMDKWDDAEIGKHAEWLASKMVSSGSVHRFNRGFVRDALAIEQGKSLENILFGKKHEFTYIDENNKPKRLDISRMTQEEMEEAAVSFSGKIEGPSYMTNLAVGMIALRLEIIKQKFPQRYAKNPDILNKAIEQQLLPMFMASSPEELAAARNRILEGSSKNQALNAVNRSAFRIRSENFNEVRVNQLMHEDAPFMVTRDNQQVELLSSDVHPKVRYAMQRPVHASWRRTQEGRIMTPGKWFNVQGGGYSRIYDRVEHESGMFEIDPDYVIDSALGEDEIQDVVRRAVILDTADRAAEWFEPPALTNRPYEDPSMSEFLRYTLERDADNQRRFADIQDRLEHYGSETSIEHKIKNTEDEAELKELNRQLAFVKSYKALRFAPIVEKDLDTLVHQFGPEGPEVYSEGGFISPHNTLGGPEGSMPEVNRYGYQQTVGIPFFRQLSIQNHPVNKKIAMLEKERSKVKKTFGFGREVFTLEERSHVSTRDLENVEPLNIENRGIIGSDYDPVDFTEMTLEERNIQMVDELDRFEKIYRIDEDILKREYEAQTGNKKYSDDPTLSIAGTDRYQVLYLLHRRMGWRARRDQSIQTLPSINEAKELAGVSNRAFNQWDHVWDYETAQWARDAITRETSITSLGAEGGIMAKRAPTPELAIRKITKKDNLHSSRSAWLFADALQSGRVLLNIEGIGRPSDRAESGMTARIIQTTDSTFILMSHREFEFGMQALYKQKYGREGTASELKEFAEGEMITDYPTKEEFNKAIADALLDTLDPESREGIGDVDLLMYVDRGDIDPDLINHGLDTDESNPALIGSIDNMSQHDVMDALIPEKQWGYRVYYNAFGEQLSTVGKVQGPIRVALTFDEKVRALMTPQNESAVSAIQMMEIINAQELPVNMSRSMSMDSIGNSTGMKRDPASYRGEAAFEAHAFAALIGADIPTVGGKQRIVPDISQEGGMLLPGEAESRPLAFINWDRQEGGYSVDSLDSTLDSLVMEDLLMAVRTRDISVDGKNANTIEAYMEGEDGDLISRMFAAGATNKTQYKAIRPSGLVVKKVKSDEARVKLLKEEDARMERVLDAVNTLVALDDAAKLSASETQLKGIVTDLLKNRGSESFPDVIELEEAVLEAHPWWPRGHVEVFVREAYGEYVQTHSILYPDDEARDVQAQSNAVTEEVATLNSNLQDEIDVAETTPLLDLEDRIVAATAESNAAIKDAASRQEFWYGPGKHQTGDRSKLDITEGSNLDKALARGAAFDSLVRDILKGTVQDSLDSGTSWDTIVAGYPVKSQVNPDLTFEPLFKDKTRFEAFKDKIDNVKKTIVQPGERIITDEIVLHNPKLQMQGRTDILVLTKDGEVKIYDIKTSNKNDWDSVIKDAPRDANTKMKKYGYQLSAYAYMIKSQLGLKTKSLGVIPIERSKETGWDVPKVKDVTLLPALRSKLAKIDPDAEPGLTVEYEAVVSRRSPKIYQGWDKPVTDKHGIFFSTAKGIVDRLDDSIKGPAGDNGASLSTRSIYEVVVVKDFEAPSVDNNFIGRGRDLVIKQPVTIEEVRNAVADENRSFIFSTRDDLSDGDIITSEDTRGQKQNIINLSNQQRKNIKQGAKILKDIKDDVRTKKGMEYVGKEKVMANSTTVRSRMNDIVNTLQAKDEQGRSFLSKKEAKLMRQVLSTWSGTEMLHDVIFNVENQNMGDASGRFSATKMDHSGSKFMRSITLLAETMRDEEDMDLGVMDILLHEIGHVVEHKLWSGPAGLDYHLTLNAFKSEEAREGILEMLNMLHKNNPKRAQEMYDHIFANDSGNIEEGLSELFAQLFSFAMISRMASDADIRRMANATGRHDGVMTLMEMFSKESLGDMREIAGILKKIRDNEGPLARLIEHMERTYIYGSIRTSESTNRFRRGTIRRSVSKTPTPSEHLRQKINHINEDLASTTLSEYNRVRLLDEKSKLEAQIDSIPTSNNVRGLTTAEEIEQIMMTLPRDDRGNMILDELDDTAQTKIRRLKLLGVAVERNDTNVDLIFERNVVGTFVPRDALRKTHQVTTSVFSPFTGRSEIELADFDLLRLFGLMGDYENLVFPGQYGEAQSLPTLQHQMTAFHGQWDRLSEDMWHYLDRRKDKFSSEEEIFEFHRFLGQYFREDKAGRKVLLESQDPEDHSFIIQYTEKFTLLYKMAIDDIRATGLVNEKMLDRMETDRVLPVRFSQEFYTGDKEPAMKAFSRVIAKEMQDIDIVDPDILSSVVNANGELMFPNYDMSGDLTTKIKQKEAFGKLQQETQERLIANYIDSRVNEGLSPDWNPKTTDDYSNIMQLAHVQAQEGKLKKSVFEEKDLDFLDRAIEDPNLIHPEGHKFIFTRFRNKRHELYTNSRNKNEDPLQTDRVLSGSEMVYFKMAIEMGTSAYMFSHNRYLSAKDIWDSSELNPYIEKSLPALAIGIQKGIGWHAYSTKAMQEITGIRGYGYLQMLHDAEQLLVGSNINDPKKVVTIVNAEGKLEEIELDRKMTSRLQKGIQIARRRYHFAGRSAAGIQDSNIELANFIHDWGVKAIMLINGPNFLPASLLVELPVGFWRRLATNALTDADVNLWAGLSDGLSLEKTRKALAGTAIAANYHKQGLSTAQLAADGNEGVHLGWRLLEGKPAPEQGNMLERIMDRGGDIATMGFGRSQLGLRAMEVMRSYQMIKGDIPKLKELRKLRNERRGDWKNLSPKDQKKAWHQTLRDAGFGSIRRETADEYWRIGLLDDHYLEVIEDWLRGQVVSEDVPSFDDFFSMIAKMEDGKSRDRARRAMEMMQNWTMRRATKTNLEMTVSSATAGVEDKLQAIMARLTSYTTMFYHHVVLRNIHTAAPAAIAGMFFAYMAMEQLYAKLMDLASGRTWEEISKEWEEDPAGSFMSAAMRIPMMGWFQFTASAILDKMRQWAAGTGLGVGYRDLRTSPGIVGMSGAEVSLNGLIGGISQWLTIPSDAIMGQDIKSSRIFKAVKPIPVPFRPVIAAAIGTAMGDQEINQRSNRGASTRYMSPSATLGAAGMMPQRGLPNASPSVLANRQAAEKARRQRFADQMRGTTRKIPKAPETPPPAPSEQPRDSVPVPESLTEPPAQNFIPSPIEGE